MLINALKPPVNQDQTLYKMPIPWSLPCMVLFAAYKVCAEGYNEG